MDFQQLYAFLSPMLDDITVGIDRDGNIVYGLRKCPELNAAIRARLGDLTPDSVYEAAWLDTEMTTAKRSALVGLLRELADGLEKPKHERVKS